MTQAVQFLMGLKTYWAPKHCIMVGNTRQDFTTMQTYHGDSYCIFNCDSGEVNGKWKYSAHVTNYVRYQHPNGYFVRLFLPF